MSYVKLRRNINQTNLKSRGFHNASALVIFYIVKSYVRKPTIIKIFIQN